MSKEPKYPNKPYFFKQEPSLVIKKRNTKIIKSEDSFFVNSCAYESSLEDVALTKEHILYLSKLIEDFSNENPEAIDISVKLNLNSEYCNEYEIQYHTNSENKKYATELAIYNEQKRLHEMAIGQYEIDVAAYEAWRAEENLKKAKELIAKHEAKIANIKKKVDL